MNDEKVINDEWGKYGKCIVPSRIYQVYNRAYPNAVLLSKENESSVIIDGSLISGELIDKSVDYKITGEVSQPLTISGNSISLDNTAVSGGSILNLSSLKTISSNNLKVSGDYPKENGNSAINIKDSEQIIFKDLVFDATCYNAIEIGLSGEMLPKGILFENCQFLGDFSNNAILVFGTAPECTINIKNCYFQSVSNILRLSNKTNTSCVVNISNCKCDKWDSNLEYQGIILCQDYTSETIDAENSNNLFAPEKIKINIKNLTGPDGKLVRPDNISDVCGSKDNNQLIYVYRDKSKSVLDYNPSMYPTLNIV